MIEKMNMVSREKAAWVLIRGSMMAVKTSETLNWNNKHVYVCLYTHPILLKPCEVWPQINQWLVVNKFKSFFYFYGNMRFFFLQIR